MGFVEFEEELKHFLIQHGYGEKKAYWFASIGSDFKSEFRPKKGLRQWIAKSDHFEVYFDDGKETVRLRDANASRTHLMVFCYSKLRTCCLAAVQLSSPVLDLNMLRM